MKSDSTTYRPGEFPVKDQVESKAASADENKKVMVLSDEMFVSYSKVRDKGMVARRIEEAFAPDRVIFTIRNQLELLKSAYLSRGRMLLNVPRRFTGLAVSFEQWLELSFENIERSYIGHARFIYTIDYYARLFGKENIAVFPLEELIQDKETHLRRLSQFLGIDAAESIACVKDAHEHKDISQAALDAELLRTRYFPVHKFPPVSQLLKLTGFIKKKRLKGAVANVAIPPHWQEKLETLYRKGNRRLADEFRLPLETYRYPM
jgi:hypothetical protein